MEIISQHFPSYNLINNFQKLTLQICFIFISVIMSLLFSLFVWNRVTIYSKWKEDQNRLFKFGSSKNRCQDRIRHGTYLLREKAFADKGKGCRLGRESFQKTTYVWPLWKDRGRKGNAARKRLRLQWNLRNAHVIIYKKPHSKDYLIEEARNRTQA